MSSNMSRVFLALWSPLHLTEKVFERELSEVSGGNDLGNGNVVFSAETVAGHIPKIPFSGSTAVDSSRLLAV
jgi:hypothetical protein